MNTNQKIQNDSKIDVRLKIASLWIVYMFLFIYIDYYKLFIPGTIKEMMLGIIDGTQSTPLLLLIFAIITIIPALMIFLTLATKTKVNRWLNLIMGIFYIGIGIASLTGHVWPFWIFYCSLLVLDAVLIVIYSWKWK